MTNTNTNQDLGQRFEQVVREHIAASRKAAQEAIERAFAWPTPSPRVHDVAAFAEQAPRIGRARGARRVLLQGRMCEARRDDDAARGRRRQIGRPFRIDTSVDYESNGEAGGTGSIEEAGVRIVQKTDWSRAEQVLERR